MAKSVKKNPKPKAKKYLNIRKAKPIKRTTQKGKKKQLKIRKAKPTNSGKKQLRGKKQLKGKKQNVKKRVVRTLISNSKSNRKQKSGKKRDNTKTGNISDAVNSGNIMDIKTIATPDAWNPRNKKIMVNTETGSVSDAMTSGNMDIKTVATPDAWNPRNKKIILLPSLAAKRSNELVFILGTGISFSVEPSFPGLKSWKDFLICLLGTAVNFNILGNDEISQILNMLQHETDLATIGESLKSLLSSKTGKSTGYFGDCLKQIFDPVGLTINQHGEQLLRTIVEFLRNDSLIISLNFDLIIERFGNKVGQKITAIDMTTPNLVMDWTKGLIKSSIYHPHGIYTKPQGVVMSTDGYMKILNNKMIMNALQELFHKRSAVFIGTSLRSCDKTVQHLIDTAVKKQSPTEHYLLINREEIQGFANFRTENLDRNIKVVPYGSFEDLSYYLEQLLHAIRHNK